MTRVSKSQLGSGIAVALLAMCAVLMFAAPADAQVAPVNPTESSGEVDPIVTPVPPQAGDAAPQQPQGAQGPAGPQGPEADPVAGNASINLDLSDVTNSPSQSILIILLITVLSVSPAILIMVTSFTRVIIVLGLTRNALGVPGVPPNQVLVGLALFVSLFIMAPTLTDMNNEGVQPYLAGEITQEVAFERTTGPLKDFMLRQTREDELALFVNASGETPETPDDVGLTVLIPAFVLSELKTAFIIGFVIFIPFLVIDIIISSSLMAMGMMMLPPQMISLPFKLLLFVLVDGWALVVKSLLSSFN